MGPRTLAEPGDGAGAGSGGAADEHATSASEDTASRTIQGRVTVAEGSENRYRRPVLVPGYRIDWNTPAGALLVLEPRLDEVATHARELAIAYNEPRNAVLMGHQETISETEVVDHYEAMLDAGAHPFLLYLDGALAGDADLRGIANGAAEFAFMVAAPSAQGHGLGTRFAMMVHAYGFQVLSLEHLYASVVPANVASRRVFEKLGFTLDDTPAARAFAEQPDDVTFSIDRMTFEGLHVADLAEIHVVMR
jgi:RimJ/RimL family protein N-acetyltransferase